MTKLPRCADPKPFIKGKLVIATERGWEAVNPKGQNELLVQCKGLDKIVGVDLYEGQDLTNSIDDLNLIDKLKEDQDLLEDEFKDELTTPNKETGEVKKAVTRQTLTDMPWEELKTLASDNEVTGNSRVALVNGVCEVLGIK